MFGFLAKVSPTWMDIMLGGFHLVLNHHLEYSHVTAWRMINDKAHPINGHAFAKRPLFISCTCHNKNSVIKIRWFPSDVYQKPRCLCASSHVLRWRPMWPKLESAKLREQERWIDVAGRWLLWRILVLGVCLSKSLEKKKKTLKRGKKSHHVQMFLAWCETHKSFEKKLPGHGVLQESKLKCWVTVAMIPIPELRLLGGIPQ